MYDFICTYIFRIGFVGIIILIDGQSALQKHMRVTVSLYSGQLYIIYLLLYFSMWQVKKCHILKLHFLFYKERRRFFSSLRVICISLLCTPVYVLDHLILVFSYCPVRALIKHTTILSKGLWHLPAYDTIGTVRKTASELGQLLSPLLPMSVNSSRF